MTNERRQYSPIYRDMVADLAQGYVLAHDHDYDAAYEDCREDYIVAELTEDPGARMWGDAAKLLRRRADTVKGLHNA